MTELAATWEEFGVIKLRLDSYPSIRRFQFSLTTIFETDCAYMVFFDGVHRNKFSLTANAVNDAGFTETMNVFWFNTNSTHKLPLTHHTGSPHKFGPTSIKLEAGRIFYFDLLMFTFVIVRNGFNTSKNEQKTRFRV